MNKYLARFLLAVLASILAAGCGDTDNRGAQLTTDNLVTVSLPTQTESGDDSSVDKSAMERSTVEVVLIHRSDEREQLDANAWKEMLAEYQIKCYLVAKDAVTSDSLVGKDVVIVAAHTSERSEDKEVPWFEYWGSPDAVELLKESELPILGVGDGAQCLFGQMGCSPGGGKYAHGRARECPLGPDVAKYLRGPAEITSTEQIQICKSEQPADAYHNPQPPMEKILLLQGAYYAVVRSKGYVMWGCGDQAEVLTENGRKLFANIVHDLAQPDTVVPRLTMESSEDTPAVDQVFLERDEPADVLDGDVNVKENAIWNNKVYISWQNVTHVNMRGPDNMVIDTWKVDDDGDGDPRNDENRIRPGVQAANGIKGSLGSLDAHQSGAAATATPNDDGSATVTLACANDDGVLKTSYTIRPNDENIYGELHAVPKADSTLYWGIDQINNVWVRRTPGEMATYNKIRITEATHEARPAPLKVDTKEGVDFWTKPCRAPDYIALISTDRQWTTGMVITSAPEGCQMQGNLVMGSKYGGWAFGRCARLVAPNEQKLEAGLAYRASAIFHADRNLDMEGFEQLMAKHESDATRSHSPLPNEQAGEPDVGHELDMKDDFSDDDLQEVWIKKINGCAVEAVDGELRIHGTAAEGGWGKSNGVKTEKMTDREDFDISVDFKVPQFEARGSRLIYLGGGGPPSQNVAMFYSVGFGYRVQTWEPRAFSDWLLPFGDEDKAFHRMRLVFNAEDNTATGYVDDQKVGSLVVKEAGNLELGFTAATEAKGAEIDVRFDNFRATSTIAEPDVRERPVVRH